MPMINASLEGSKKIFEFRGAVTTSHPQLSLVTPGSTQPPSKLRATKIVNESEGHTTIGSRGLTAHGF